MSIIETPEQLATRMWVRFEDLKRMTGITNWKNPSSSETLRFALELPNPHVERAMPDWVPGTRILRKSPIVRCIVPPAGASMVTAEERERWTRLGYLISDDAGVIAMPACLDQAMQQTKCGDPLCGLDGFRCVDQTHAPRTVVGGVVGSSMQRVLRSPLEQAPRVHEAILSAEDRLLARARAGGAQ